MSRPQPEDFRSLQSPGSPDRPPPTPATDHTPDPASTRLAHATRWTLLGLLALGCGEALLQLFYLLPAWLRGQFLPARLASANDQEVFLWLTPLRILWPLALAFWISRAPSPRLLRAAGATALVLLLDRGIGMMHEVVRLLERQARIAGTSPSGMGTAAIEGLSPLAIALHSLLFLAAAQTLKYAWNASRTAIRAAAATPRSARSPRERYPLDRLAELAAWSLGLALIAAHGWSLYLDQLHHLPQLRSLMMGPIHQARFQPRTRPVSPLGLKFQDASNLAQQAQNAAQKADFKQARQKYAQAATLFREIVQADSQWAEDIHAQHALLCNNLAWAFITAPDPATWDPAAALPLARAAVELAPGEGNYWNTLAVAQFRARHDQPATSSFNTAMQLRAGGDGYDWFFLAQIEARAGRAEQANAWYDRAQHWAATVSPADPLELHRIHAEAAAALGKPAPTPIQSAQAAAQAPRFGDLSSRRASNRRDRNDAAAQSRAPLRRQRPANQSTLTPPSTPPSPPARPASPP